jgi:hypothetical protein
MSKRCTRRALIYREIRAKAARITNRVTSADRNDLSDALVVASPAYSVRVSVPNKPVVPTVPTSLAANPPNSLRRHIGRPLGSLQNLGRSHFSTIRSRTLVWQLKW